MLDEQTLSTVVGELVGSASVLGHDLAAETAALIAADLLGAGFPVSDIRSAMRRVRSEFSGRLTLKVVLDKLEELHGRLAPNEAWAVAFQSHDESCTVVWTDEIESAWWEAKPLMDAGDNVAARMAFISAYERVVRDARAARKLPVTTLSLGWDADKRREAVEQAHKSGRISAARATALLGSVPQRDEPQKLLAAPSAGRPAKGSPRVLDMLAGLMTAQGRRNMLLQGEQQ